jgi:hypothetical protein
MASRKQFWEPRSGASKRLKKAALDDEATGYQDDRAKDALAKIFTTLLAKERQKWMLTFPLDFYKEIYRLRGWKFEPWNTKRPTLPRGLMTFRPHPPEENDLGRDARRWRERSADLLPDCRSG